MRSKITLDDAITEMALCARIHNDSKQVLRTARLCLKKLPRASWGAVAMVMGSHRPVDVAIMAYEDLVEQGYFDEK